jgi:crossover junction endodeoxyribonuclease RuvC
MNAPRRVLGIDPGLAATGYGLVDGRGSDAALVASGAIRTRSKDPRARRLALIAERVGELIDEYRPVEVAIEQQFVAENVRSAMALGEARAAVMVTAAQRGLSVYEYPPAEVKESICGYGAASKEQVLQMVMVHLGLNERPSTLDASDALAIALTRLAEARFDALPVSDAAGRPR